MNKFKEALLEEQPRLEDIIAKAEMAFIFLKEISN